MLSFLKVGGVIRSIFLTSLGVFVTLSAQAVSDCLVFKIHPQFVDPAPYFQPAVPSKNSELIIAEISRFPNHQNFGELFGEELNAMKQHGQTMTEEAKARWLSCLLHYVQQDTNHNGIPDWTAIVDNRPARTLVMLDPDADGDGIENVMDPFPLRRDHQLKISSPSPSLPEHLLLSEGRELQERLFKKFNILAINHSDEHSPFVLAQLLLLLEKAFSDRHISTPHTLKYLYAFSNHDTRGRIASFHPTAQAMSVGGKWVYSRSSVGLSVQRVELLATLAHEIGHALAFERLTPTQLAQAASTFGKWKLPVALRPFNFYAPLFFLSHPLRAIATQTFASESDARAFVHRPQWSENNLMGVYSTQNVHEWFADAVGATLLQGLASKGVLEKRDLELTLPTQPGRYWSNYGNLRKDFRDWIEANVLKAKSN